MSATVLGLFLVAWPSSFAISENEPQKPPEKTVAREVRYSGEVQGVGFRATAERIARDYPVTGWVKNLADGRVQLLAEGPEEALRTFLGEVRSRFRGYITDEHVEALTPSGRQTRFQVVR